PLFREYLNSILSKGQAVGLAKFQSPSGKTIIVEYTNSTHRDLSGKLIIRSIGRNVTERDRAAAELRESEERLRLALTAAQMGAWEWNIAADKMIGDEYVLGLLDINDGGLDKLLEKVHPDDRKLVFENTRSLGDSKELHNLQFRIFDAYGQERWVESSASLRQDHLGQPVRAIGIMQEVTKKKKSDESYR